MYTPGYLLLWTAFLLGILSTVGYLLAVRTREAWIGLARQAYVIMTVAIVATSALLMYLLVHHDYRLFYVYAYSDNSLPTSYLVSSFWGGQEGSFLLWIFWGVLLGLPLMRFARGYETRVMVFYNATLLSLIAILLRQNPFRFHQGLTAGSIPMDGQGLNPLLQNPWMVIHPPIMFIGYASLSVPFAFALAALWMRRYDEWPKVSMPWVLLSLATLGLAIMLGGYWAYETLGWGGYWGWDPVENASFVPWLATAALTHGMLLQRNRNRFRRLNLVLAMSAYLLVVYGTFLTRSGVLANFSVHSFVDLGITGWLVFNMLFFLALSIGMLAWRWREIPAEGGDEQFVSRTVFFVVGILLLVLLAVVVAFGTSAPLISRLWGEPSQVGPSFYNRMGYWLAVVFALFLGVTPFLGWRRAMAGTGRRLVVVAAVTAALLGLGIALGLNGPRAILYAAAAIFAIVANVWAASEKIASRQLKTAGGIVAHVGLGLMLLAFLTTGWFDHGEKVRLKVDVPQQVMGYTMTFRGVEKPNPAARDAMVVDVTDPRGKNFVLKPKMWVNRKSNQLVANPDIRSFLTSDLYLAPVEYDPGEEAPVSGRLTLKAGTPANFKDWTLTFDHFDMASQNAVPGALTVGMVVRLERPGAALVDLEPSVVSTDGGVQAVAVDIPGTSGGKIRVAGLNVGSESIQVELLGLGGGIARSQVLHKGESLSYSGMKITFQDFDLSDFDPQAGKINFDAIFDVDRGGRSTEVRPSFHGGGPGGPVITPAAVPGAGGVTLSIGKVDAEGGTVEVQVFDPNLAPQAPKPASLVLDVSTKPLIGLVWIGTLLTLLGVIMAITLRRRDIASIPIVEV